MNTAPVERVSIVQLTPVFDSSRVFLSLVPEGRFAPSDLRSTLRKTTFLAFEVETRRVFIFSVAFELKKKKGGQKGEE